MGAAALTALAGITMLPAGQTAAATRASKRKATTPTTVRRSTVTSTSTGAPTGATGGATALAVSYTLPRSVGSVDLTKLPLGDSRVSMTTPSKGGIWACHTDPAGGGASVVGPWIDTAAATFDYTAKYIVDGDVSWPSSSSSKVVGDRRVFTSNDLPTHTTGSFPIASTDDAYKIDRNPSPITAQTLSFSLPATPKVNASPSCTPGQVGITLDGVEILDALDAPGRDAVAHETQDHCDGHPNPHGYHYHNLSRCITENTDGSGRLVGWIIDGFPLMSRMENGRLVTNADLDECHGHTGEVTIDGRKVTTYHYHATYEFPYTVGCLRGTAAQVAGAPTAAGGQNAAGQNAAGQNANVATGGTPPPGRPGPPPGGGQLPPPPAGA